MNARAAAFFCAFVLIAGCTKVQSESPSQGARHAYTHPHELRFATAEDIAGLNPMFADQAVVLYLGQMTMAWLIRADEHSIASIPELATEVPTLANHGISADGKSITWHLRHGVKWSDGAPFTADDVVFSTQQVLNPQNNVISRDGWDLITKIDEPDKYTVVYHLSKPYSSYAYTFFSSAGANPAIVPKHLLGGRAELNDAPYNSKPVGIGPFVFQSWKRSDSVVLAANPNYWRGAPKLQRVVYKLIPDRETVMTQLRTHEIDLWLPVTPHYVPRVKQIDGVTLGSIPSFTFDHLDFNLTHPIVQDHAVREALRYAYPRKEILDKIGGGLFLLDESPVTPASGYHDPSIGLIPFDLAKANQILDAAGWRRGADGIRVKSGLRLSLDYAAIPGNADIEAGREMLRAAWKAVGAEIVVKYYAAPLYFAQAQAGGIVYGGKFDITAFAWSADPNDDLSNLYACYRFPPNGQNVPRWCNTAATAAMDRAKATYLPQARVKDIHFVQQAVVRDIPTIVTDARVFMFAYNSDLKNWHPGELAPFDNMLQVDI
jgi:peptide/nickel transport system substrate-binding protein